jgi:hypothetical protein
LFAVFEGSSHPGPSISMAATRGGGGVSGLGILAIVPAGLAILAITVWYWVLSESNRVVGE